MADADKSTKAFRDWQDAEAAYSKSLAAFSTDGPPSKVRKDSAVELATLRSRADAARDKYFKRALK